jgi:mono/diheme cytochrome c family protein
VAHDGKKHVLAPGYFLWIVALLASGCQQKMADQPYYKDLQPNKFFADGRSARPAVPGTVARGHLQTDVALFTGRRTGKNGEPLGAAMPTTVQPPAGSREAAAAEKAQYDFFVDEFPFPMTKEVLEHGRDRYTIYCVVCHDALGTGRGKIVERGYTQPPSYHIERLRNAPPGYLFAVMTEGYGSMPSYEAQVPVRDRWAIAGYLRALQASQHFPQNSPLPLGEGQGVRAAAGAVSRRSSRESLSPNPHPNPLPKGEGTDRSAAAPEGKSP